MIYAYLILALLIATLGAFTDIRTGRVKNKHLAIALLIWFALIFFESIFEHAFVVSVFAFILNVILAFITALIFYFADIWAPGDCKLYITISIIFPMNAYVVRGGNIFPALDFVIYAFALGYIALVIMSIRLHDESKVSKLAKPNMRRILSILSSVGIISVVHIMLEIYATNFFYANQMLCTLSLIGLLCILQQKADVVRKILGFISLICFLIWSIIYGSWLNACLSLLGSLVIASIVEIINSRAYANTYREISKDEVRPGMILSFSTLWAMQKCIDPELPKTTTENRRSRLTERQAIAVKTWCKNARRNVIIVEMMPFAPFIASAVLIQILRFTLLRLLGH